jgi:hypothetical protein
MDEKLKADLTERVRRLQIKESHYRTLYERAAEFNAKLQRAVSDYLDGKISDEEARIWLFKM